MINLNRIVVLGCFNKSQYLQIELLKSNIGELKAKKSTEKLDSKV